jgi:hypothetical protein
MARYRNTQYALSSVENPTEEEVMTFDNWMLPTPAAQQIFSLVPAVAGGLAGILFAYRLTQSRAIEVKGSEVMWATVVSFAASFGAVFLMKTFTSYEDR